MTASPQLLEALDEWSVQTIRILRMAGTPREVEEQLVDSLSEWTHTSYRQGTFSLDFRRLSGLAVSALLTAIHSPLTTTAPQPAQSSTDSPADMLQHRPSSSLNIPPTPTLPKAAPHLPLTHPPKQEDEREHRMLLFDEPPSPPHTLPPTVQVLPAPPPADPDFYWSDDNGQEHHIDRIRARVKATCWWCKTTYVTDWSIYPEPFQELRDAGWTQAKRNGNKTWQKASCPDCYETFYKEPAPRNTNRGAHT